MRVLITGASGFVGRQLLRLLAERGHLGVAVSRTPPSIVPPGWRWITREALLGMREDVDRTDCVIHLEVKQHVDSPSLQDVAEFRAVNVDGTRQWLRWCERAGVDRFMHFSSIKAVGDSDLEQDETSQSPPSTLYGVSKREAEGLVREWAAAARGRLGLVLRPAVIYGPESTANVFSMLQAIDRGRFLLIGGGTTIKSLVSIRNVAAAAEHLMLSAHAGCEIYNIVDRHSYDVKTIARMLAVNLGRKDWFPSLPVAIARAAVVAGETGAQLFGWKFPLTKTRLAALTQATRFSPAKLISTGFSYPQSTEDGLEEMVDWYRAARRRQSPGMQTQDS